MHGLNKVPIIIPEGGVEPSYEECSNYTQHVVDKGSGQINPVIWFVAERRGSSMRPEYNNPKSEKIEENYIKDVVSFRHEDDKEIKIYPNPFQNYFKVKSPSEDNLLLIDIHGRILLELLIANGISKISTETLSKGVYTVVLIKQNAHFKLIKQ